MPELSREEFKERITPPDQRRVHASCSGSKGVLPRGEHSREISPNTLARHKVHRWSSPSAVSRWTPKEELLEMMKKFDIYPIEVHIRGEINDDLSKERAKARLNLNVDEPSFNPKGEMYPLIVTERERSQRPSDSIERSQSSKERTPRSSSC